MSKTNFTEGVVIVVCLSFPILLGGCLTTDKHSTVDNRRQSSSQDQQTIAPANDTTCLSLESLNNALIHDEEFGWVRLKNGEYSTHVKDSLGGDIYYVDDFTFADLDNDGYKDAIGTLSVNTGGSGCFHSMVIFLNKRGSPVYTDSYFIGDREGIDSIKIVGSTLDVFFLKHGPHDGMAIPTATVEKKFKFIKNKLIELK